MKVLTRPERRKFRQETVVHSYITRPLSIEVARILWDTKITPNQITIFRSILNIISLFLLATGSIYYVILGFILFHIHEVLDAADGLYARLKGLESKKGYYLEILLDTIFSTSYGLLGLSIVIGMTRNLLLYELMIVFIMFLLFSLLNEKILMVIPRQDGMIKEDLYKFIPIINNNNTINFKNLLKTMYIWQNELLLIFYVLDIIYEKIFVVYFFGILSLYTGLKLCKNCYRLIKG